MYLEEIYQNGKLIGYRVKDTDFIDVNDTDKLNSFFENGFEIIPYSEVLSKRIEDYIYSKYPQSKQNSDLADKLYYENLLKAKGIKNLEADIVKRVEEYYKGKNLDEVISDVADENKESYLQLIKVGIRVTWVQMCKNELKKAIEEQREPEFPEYPL